LGKRVVGAEPLKVVVAVEHELAAAGAPVPVERLVRFPLLVCRSFGDGDSDALRLLTRRGVIAHPRGPRATPPTPTALARAGVGGAGLNAVALAPLDLRGLAVLDLDEPDHSRVVAAY